MTLIEGVGDEVVQCAAALLVLAVAALAWWSTSARPDRYRTVLVMRSRALHPVTVSIRTRSNLMLSSSQASSPSPGQASTSDAAASPASSPSSAVESRRRSARLIPLQEMDSIVDADMALLDNNRLHFYRRMHVTNTTQVAAESSSDESETQEEVEPTSNAQIREMDSIVSAMEAEVTAGCDFFTRPGDSNSATSAAEAKATKTESGKDESAATASYDTKSDEVRTNAADQGSSGEGTREGSRRKILIKLKYLNDTLKEVEGSLDELLKDFKWRHFSTELSSESRVRLIFNGRVLIDDAATLRACGLHDRAVVHCLVHPKRATNQPRGAPDEPLAATHELVTEGAPPERSWDLENVLMTLVSVALTVVWFFRCEYSSMFTASASVALFGLTVFYSVAIFGIYLSDTIHLERRPAPAPVPAPAPAD